MLFRDAQMEISRAAYSLMRIRRRATPEGLLSERWRDNLPRALTCGTASSSPPDIPFCQNLNRCSRTTTRYSFHSSERLFATTKADSAVAEPFHGRGVYLKSRPEVRDQDRAPLSERRLGEPVRSAECACLHSADSPNPSRAWTVYNRRALSFLLIACCSREASHASRNVLASSP